MADIDIRDVVHAYRTAAGPLPVLDGLNVRVKDGAFVAVVGPSGCGKSTLTKLVAGLLIPNGGSVSINGQRVKGPRASTGMAFQNPVLLEWRSIEDNVLLPLEIVKGHGLNRSQQRERERELLAMVGLNGFEDKRPSELSGGMRQRASLCRALVHRPEVLILDEPFGALDAFTREDLWVTMRALRQQEAFTAILITHDLRESVFLGDEVVVLSGRPARTQMSRKVDLPADRDLGSLYQPEAAALLRELREQIAIAQGRTGDIAQGRTGDIAQGRTGDIAQGRTGDITEPGTNNGAAA